jgi:hypothetical protein
MRLSEGRMSALQCKSSSGSLPEYCAPQVVARHATHTSVAGASAGAGAVARRSRASSAYAAQQAAAATASRA